MKIDPVIAMIYRIYFYQDELKICGISDEVALLSALQMEWHKAKVDMWNPYSPARVHDSVVLNRAYNFVKKYSTCENL